MAAVAAMFLVMVGSLSWLGLLRPPESGDSGPQVAVLSPDTRLQRSGPDRLDIEVEPE